MANRNDVPLLFRADGRRFREKPKPVYAFLDEKTGELLVGGVRWSLEMLQKIAPEGSEPKGPFWIGREGGSVVLYEMEEVAEAVHPEAPDGVKN